MVKENIIRGDCMSYTKNVERLLDMIGLEVPPETIERYSKVLLGIVEPKENFNKIIKGIFPEDFDGMIVEKDIPIFSYCEHHILPWFGVCHIGYISEGKVLGLSKFTRIVNYFSSGLTLQERVTNEIANFFEDFVSEDVIVKIEALHTCKVARGIMNPFSKSVTIEARNKFRTNEGTRMEFFNSIQP